MLTQIVRLFPCLLLLAGLSHAQGLQCLAVSAAPVVHTEGVSELVGDITANCQGGQPNAVTTGNLTIFLSVNITNRIDAFSNSDIRFSYDNGNGPTTAAAVAQITGPNQAVFNGLTFQLSNTGSISFRIVNIRGNANQSHSQPIYAQLAYNGSSLISLLTNQFTVAFPVLSLLTSSVGSLVGSQPGSPAPGDVTSFAGFLAARSAVSSIRVTEGFATAFTPKQTANNSVSDSGVRLIVRYHGFPTVAHLYVPDVIVGANGVTQTSVGNLGRPIAGGSFTGGVSTLLLALVRGANSSGAGGSPAIPVPAASAGVVQFDKVSEVSIDEKGEAYAVYEVISADPNAVESAQLPTFLTLASNTGVTATNTSQEVFLAPISNDNNASVTAPVPRFVAVTPGSDCAVLRDCGASYFPQLNIGINAGLTFNVPLNGGISTQYIPIQNGGAGVLQWRATVTYDNGSGWLRLDPTSGVNNGTIRVDANPAGLALGTYTATIHIDGGQSGTKNVAVTLNVGAAGTANFGIQSINVAYPAQTGLVAGSRAIISGTGLSDAALAVFVNDVPATIVDRQAGTLTIVIPEAAAGISVGVLRVNSGTSSATIPVNLVAQAPLILPGGVRNLDFSVNGPNNPAVAGTAFQVFATGLPAGGKITGRVHDIDIFTPLYAGSAPNLPGVQQVNLQIDPLFPTFQTYIYVCGQFGEGPRICSPAVPIWLKAKQ